MAQDELELDEIDRGILQLLQRDARHNTTTEIGEALDVSHSTVSSRIQALEDSDVIDGYTVNINFDRVGVNPKLLVVADVPAPEREPLAREAIDMDGVTAVRSVLNGRRNLHLTIVGREIRELARISGHLEDQGIDIIDTGVVRLERRRPFDHFGEAAFED